MADANLTKRIAELEAKIERLTAEAATSRPLRRRLGGKLTDRKLKSFNQPGHIIGDDNNLLCKCGGLGHGCWIYRYKVHGRARDIGLGGYPTVSLAEARIARDEHNRLRNQGQDPRTERQRQKDAAKLVRAKAMTFAQCAEALFRKEETGWSSPKHAQQWMQILKDYIDPVLGAQPIVVIDTGHVMKVLEPIWKTKTESATRARQIIEAVIDWAAASEYRPTGDNPARWRGHLERLLPKKSMVKATKHHAAPHYDKLPGFMARLRQDTSIAARCLEVTILCCLRTNESRLAQWTEIDTPNKVWIVPAERMKGKKGQRKEHRVPLSEPVIAMLKELCRHKTNRFVFSAPGAVKPIGVNAMLQVLARLDVAVTTHGFRSTFTDWCSEKTSYPVETRELCLAHTIDTAVQKAYRRDDLLEKRAPLMAQWAKYATSLPPEGEVVPFTRQVG